MPGQVLPTVSSFLSVGQAFTGTQTVSHRQGSKEDAWQVLVRVQGADFEKGYLCGSMEALNAPSTNSSVVTFWEGEIVDNRNHFFHTAKWDATVEHDLKHWRSIPCFAPYADEVEKNGGQGLDLKSSPVLFMRWKERFFVNVSPDCGLTIAGFYYLRFSRVDGSISGYYSDPNSRELRPLTLHLIASCSGAFRGILDALSL